ncbi:MAG: type II toxin-antitoxin system HicB family antitoxin [Chitinophagaceae bacterium]|nr:type II toxin-antitoxin system HicB family antitoxin [Anaerolineae bacterium]
MKTIDDYRSLPYAMVITPNEEGYGVAIPDLPGCYTHAEKWEDIQAMIQEAMALWMGVMLEDGKPIPEPAAQALY